MTRHFVTDIPNSTATEEPADNSNLSAAEHESAARALEAAGQKPEAVSAWHRAAVSHSRSGDHDKVIACIGHAERLAGNNAFSPDVKRKGTAADWRSQPVERVGEDGDLPTTPAIERDRDWKRPRNATAAAANKSDASTEPKERL
jgi:hypothetical protein